MRSGLPSSFAKIGLIFCLAVLAMSSAFAQDTSADGFSASPPSSVGVTLQGCRNDGSLNPTNFPMVVGGTPYYICPDNMYTNGDLGKNWAELDNVPFRLIIKDNEKADGSTLATYNVVVAGDHFDDAPPTQRVGYFVVSTPELDPGCALGSCLASPSSDPACSVSVVSSGGDRFATGITGGTYDTIYETLAISQPTGSTCVFDYYQTLAIGAHLFNGSNLQAYKFEDAAFKGGKQTVPLPVNPCSNGNPGCIPSPPPQALSKTMDASQNQENIWTVSKSAPAGESFNSCNLNDTSKNLSVVLTWTKTPGTQSQITITTKVYETNPSLVPLTVNVTDTIFATAIGGASTQVGTASATGVAVPANTTTLVLQDSATIDPTIYTTPYNDTANADVYDGGTLVGSLQAAACLDPTNSQCTGTSSTGPGIDNSADITDTESISDTANALTFSVQDTVPSGLGTFTYQSAPYLLPGAAIVGPLLWDSGSVSSNGSIQYDKTLYLSPAGTTTTGDLTDTATATASDTKTQTKDSADVKITSEPVTKLTINKALDSAVGTDQVFTFDVLDSGQNKVATATVIVKTSQTTGSVDITTLAPGTYTVSEENPGAPWLPLPSQQVTLSTGNLCTQSLTFSNVHAGNIVVKKVTQPTGSLQSFTFTTTGSGYSGFNLTDGQSNDSGPLAAGSYSVAETATTGWDLSSAVCDNGNDPSAIALAAGQTVTCTFTNTQQGSIQIVKNTVGGNGTFGFTSNFGVSSIMTSSNTGSQTVNNLSTTPTSPYSISETAQTGWDEGTFTCLIGTASGGTASNITVQAGKTTVCTITNTQRASLTAVKKTVNGDGTFSFTTTGTGLSGFSLTTSSGTASKNFSLSPGGYSVKETSQTGWSLTSSTCSNGNSPSAITLAAGQSVTCTFTNTRVAAKTGALTMGFWQNKNGQGIITGGASTSGVCNSGTYLRTFAPFQDLSATASCSTVATYVTNIIKAANASGSSMNAMLKAQMLATALDVYFSDPALGGNKISAPAPVGGVTIDLTKVCSMIDSSSGTGTCFGTYLNASSAFGGATSLMVSQILAYAASQSTSGGSLWYGNVKSVQQLAKNTFDAINNQAAFAP